MSYFNPYILFALIAVSIPIILHLLNLQKVQKVEFSSLMLLKEIQKSKFRRIRIKQFLLMLVRILIIVFLVLAFADPYIRNYTSSKSDIRKTGIIFIDSSFSMNAVQDSSKLIDMALNEKNEIQKLFTSSDDVRFFYTRVNKGDSGDIKPGNLRPDLSSILNVVSNYPAGGNFTEVFVVSDLQKYNFKNQITDAGKSANTNFYFIDVSGVIPGNVSLNNVNLETKIPAPSGNIRLKAAVKNNGSNFIYGAKVSLFSGNEKKDERYIDLNPGERKEVELSYTSSKYGISAGYVELSNIISADDNIPDDNKYNFSVYIPERIEIGIISGRGSSPKYLTAVFDAANSFLQKKTYDYYEVKSLNEISGIDLLYLNGFNLNSESDLDNIKKHLNAGKGLFVFPGELPGSGYLNRLGSFNYSERMNPGNKIPVAFVNTDEDLFEGLFRSETPAGDRIISPINVNSQYRITCSQNSYPVISLKNLLPLLIVDRSYSGIILASSVSADKSMSDFPNNDFFAPLILRSAGFLSYNYLAGENQARVYNHDTLESNLIRTDRKELSELLTKSGFKKFRIIGRNELKDIPSIVEENRKGKSFWKYCVIAVLMLVLTELFLVKKVYKNE